MSPLRAAPLGTHVWSTPSVQSVATSARAVLIDGSGAKLVFLRGAYVILFRCFVIHMPATALGNGCGRDLVSGYLTPSFRVKSCAMLSRNRQALPGR